MRGKIIFWTAYTLIFGLLMAALPKEAEAGSPMICVRFDIGDAASLPMAGRGWSALRADYDLSRLVEDTVALLGPETPVIVRMETLRRATVYAEKDRHIARALLERLVARARAADGQGQSEALAWFDLGYLVESYKQNEDTESSLVRGIDGYGWVLKAMRLRGQDAEMEFAAALITYGRRAQDEHLRKAAAGAKEGSLLARNLVGQFGHRGKTLAELRTSMASVQD